MSEIDWTPVAKHGIAVLAVLLFAVLFIIIFRPQIAALLERLSVKFRRGGAELSTCPSATVPEGGDELATGQSQEQRGVLDEDKVSELSGRQAMLEAYNNRDMAALEAAFHATELESQDLDERIDAKALYLAMRAGCGDQQAMASLRDMASAHPQNASVHSFLVATFAMIGDFERAAAAALAFADAASDPDERASFLRKWSDYVAQQGGAQEALDLLHNEVTTTSSPVALTRLYGAMADVYLRTKDWFSRAVALELSNTHSTDPDSSSKFDLAYAYAEAGLYALAVETYKELLRVKPSYPSGHNNLGVALQHLGNKFSATKAYRESSELREALGNANLASLYIEAGMESEAKTLLDEALSFGSEQAAVHQRLNTLHSQLADEQKVALVQGRNAKEVRAFIRTAGAQYLSSVPDLSWAEGSWVDEAGIEYTVSVSPSGQIRVTFEEARRAWTAKSTSATTFQLNLESCSYLDYSQKRLSLLGPEDEGAALLRSEADDSLLLLLAPDKKPASHRRLARSQTQS